MAEISMYRGDTKIINMQVFDEVAVPFVLTGCKIWFTAKAAKSDADVAAIFSIDSAGPSVVISNAGTGSVDIELLPTATAGLVSAGTLFYDIQLKDSIGRVFTIDTGTIEILEDITRSTT